MYRVLYRKWRPQVFSDVVGQPHITRTLSAEVRENRLAHAYLFTGSRGTGKTTCAKILSKAINCLHPVNGDPCNECEICRGIDNGTLLDIVEIDAASNRGIDDIRLLRDESNFTPAQATYRVYIIDEVHMLTIEAFNALLKTLEEPPAHVKFILATTEVHKLPSTILSRCQRFDFRRIEPRVIADRLLYVAQQEKVTLHEDAAMLIARIADGGMRDALSLLDSAMSVSDEITAAVVSDCAGLMGRDQIYALLRAIAACDTAACLSILDALHSASCDTERLIGELTNQFRNFLIMKTVQHPENLIVCTADELNTLQSIAALFSNEQILYALNVLTKTTDAVKRTQNRRIEAEMAMIRLCTPETDSDTSALLARISKLEETVKALSAGGIPAPAAKPAPAQTPAVQKPAPIPAEPEPAPLPAEPEPAPVWKAPEPEAQPVSTPASPPPAANAPEDDDDPFEGFGNENTSGTYASMFDDEETDDEPFDFDAFIKEHSGNAGNEPAQEEPPSPAPAPAPAPAQSAPVQPAEETKTSDPSLRIPSSELRTPEGQVDSRKWLKVVADTEASHPPLINQLTGSRARIVGDVLSVCLADPKIKMFINEDLVRSKLAPVAERILGRRYDIRFE